MTTKSKAKKDYAETVCKDYLDISETACKNAFEKLYSNMKSGLKAFE